MDTGISGLALLAAAAVFAAVLLLVRLAGRRHSQRADRGGIVIGGDNRGVANTGRIGGSAPAPAWERWLAILASIAGVAGFGLTLWDRLA